MVTPSDDPKRGISAVFIAGPIRVSRRPQKEPLRQLLSGNSLSAAACRASCPMLVSVGRLPPGVLLAMAQGIDDLDRKSTRLNSSHSSISYAVFCLKKKKYTTVRYLTNHETGT